MKLMIVDKDEKPIRGLRRILPFMLTKQARICAFFCFCVISIEFAGCASFHQVKDFRGTKEIKTQEDITRIPLAFTSPKDIKSELIFAPAEILGTRPSLDYVVGVNDSLYINVNGQKDIGSPPGGTPGKVQGSRVDGKGFIYLPLSGKVHVEGETVGQITQELTGIFRRYFANAWVVVEISDYRSQPIYLTGAFKESGVYYLDQPTHLLQALALGKGIEMEGRNSREGGGADLLHARLVRENKIIPVDIYDLIMTSDVSKSIWLRGGDIIYVPVRDTKIQNVFVLGEVKNPGTISIPYQREMSLIQALAAAGGMGNIEYKDRNIQIIRSLSTTRGEIISVNMESLLAGNLSPILLKEGDVIYVPRTPNESWNQVLNLIRPTLQTISELLTPFVQIKFLSKN